VQGCFPLQALRWANLGQQSYAHPAAPSLPLPGRAGGEDTMTKLMGQDEAREISYQLPPQGKDTQLGEKQFNVMPVKTDLGSEKQ